MRMECAQRSAESFVFFLNEGFAAVAVCLGSAGEDRYSSGHPTGSFDKLTREYRQCSLP